MAMRFPVIKKLSSHYYLDYSLTQFLNSDFSKIHLFRSLTSKSTESNEIIVQTYSLCYNVGCQTDFFLGSLACQVLWKE